MATAVNNRGTCTKAEDMSVLEVFEWIKSNFNETVAAKFKGKLKSNSTEWNTQVARKKVKQIFRTFLLLTEQNINGKGLLFLANRGTKDQMEACGLELIGDQMKLLEVLDAMESDISFKNHQPKKLTKPSTKNIDKELHKRIYNAK